MEPLVNRRFNVIPLSFGTYRLCFFSFNFMVIKVEKELLKEKCCVGALLLVSSFSFRGMFRFFYTMAVNIRGG